VGEIEKDGFELIARGPEKDHVAGGAVEVGHAASPVVPDLAKLPQIGAAVELARRLVHPDGMEVCDARKEFRHVGIAPDDASAVSKDAHDAAVLPVGLLVIERKLKLAEHVEALLLTMKAPLLHVVDEARPRPFLELVALWCVMLLDIRHVLSLLDGFWSIVFVETSDTRIGKK